MSCNYNLIAGGCRLDYGEQEAHAMRVQVLLRMLNKYNKILLAN